MQLSTFWTSAAFSFSSLFRKVPIVGSGLWTDSLSIALSRPCIAYIFNNNNNNKWFWNLRKTHFYIVENIFVVKDLNLFNYMTPLLYIDTFCNVDKKLRSKI